MRNKRLMIHFLQPVQALNALLYKVFPIIFSLFLKRFLKNLPYPLTQAWKYDVQNTIFCFPPCIPSHPFSFRPGLQHKPVPQKLQGPDLLLHLFQQSCPSLLRPLRAVSIPIGTNGANGWILSCAPLSTQSSESSLAGIVSCSPVSSQFSESSWTLSVIPKWRHR